MVEEGAEECGLLCMSRPQEECDQHSRYGGEVPRDGEEGSRRERKCYQKANMDSRSSSMGVFPVPGAPETIQLAGV